MNTSAVFFAEEYWHFDGPRVENGSHLKRDNERTNNPSQAVAKSTLAETRRLESLTFANVGFRLNFVP